jgi:hypothetical protein
MIAITIFISSPLGHAPRRYLTRTALVAIESERDRVPPETTLQAACHDLAMGLTA